MSGIADPLLSLAQAVESQSNGAIVRLAAAVGAASGLHDEHLAREVLMATLDRMLKEIDDRASRGVPASTDLGEQFRKNLGNICLGAAKKFGSTSNYIRDGDTPYLYHCQREAKCFTDSHISTVIGYHRLKDLISVNDWDRFFGYCSIVAADGTSDELEDRWRDLASLDPADRAKRVFKVRDASAGLGGGGVLWFTPRSEVERVLSDTSEGERADRLRDVLGLFFPERVEGSDRQARADNRRFVLHIPVAAVQNATHARPTFVEAAGYSRFMACSASHTHSPPGPWGQTADLASLHARGKLDDGLPERIVVRRSAGDLNGMDIEFDYVGEIGNSRGKRPRDRDPAFARALCRQLERIYPAEARRWPDLPSLLSTPGVP
jgi:hypothetical protein